MRQIRDDTLNCWGFLIKKLNIDSRKGQKEKCLL